MKRYIHSSRIISLGRYELREENGDWYLFEQAEGELVDGPFDSEEEAREAASHLVKDHNPTITDEPLPEWVEEEDRYLKLLDRFDKYCKNVPGKFYVDGEMVVRNKKVLEQRVSAFNKSNGTDLRVKYVGSDADGDFYGVD